MTTGADVLEKAAATYRERNAVYGDNYLRLGEAMNAMFPKGLTIHGPSAWTRLYFLLLAVVKISRYTTNIDKPHMDSSLDAAVYMAMLHAYDEDK